MNYLSIKSFKDKYFHGSDYPTAKALREMMINPRVQQIRGTKLNGRYYIDEDHFLKSQKEQSEEQALENQEDRFGAVNIIDRINLIKSGKG